MNADTTNRRHEPPHRAEDIREAMDELARRAQSLRYQWRFVRREATRCPAVDPHRAETLIQLALRGEHNACQMLKLALEADAALERGELQRCTELLAEYGQRQRSAVATDRLAAMTIVGNPRRGSRRRRRRRRP